ncbi:S1C family serine protease [Asticcacaulis solisilvae]|uniref:S1C family serine protease n=1 Tax=Asticcacaulis solisilvae TaxID=1217274 RepID=UPI003FD83BAD
MYRSVALAAVRGLGLALAVATGGVMASAPQAFAEDKVYVYEDVTAQQAFDIFIDQAAKTFGKDNVVWKGTPPKLAIHSDYGGWDYTTEIFIDTVEFTARTGKVIHGVSVRSLGWGSSIIAGRGEQETFVDRTKRLLEIKDIPYVVEESRIRKTEVTVSYKGEGKAPGAKYTGTGFVVLDGTYIVTAHHVIADGKTISALCGTEAVQSAAVVATDPANDIALLRVERPLAYRMSLADDGSLHTGDKVFTIGFPVPELLGPEPKYSEGVVSALSGIQGAANVMQMTTPVQPGNSGGPVVDASGHIVGVVDAEAEAGAFYRGVGTLPQNINWAVKSAYVRPLLQQYAGSAAPAKAGKEALSPIELTKRAACFLTVTN